LRKLDAQRPKNKALEQKRNSAANRKSGRSRAIRRREDLASLKIVFFARLLVVIVISGNSLRKRLTGLIIQAEARGKEMKNIIIPINYSAVDFVANDIAVNRPEMRLNEKFIEWYATEISNYRFWDNEHTKEVIRLLAD
jgi:hypothetical protein